MPVELVEGDLLAVEGLPALAHGCNCAGAMGKGIAPEFRRRWPRMYEEYRHRCRAGQFSLGDVLAWDDDGRTVFNLGTQRAPGVAAQPEAIERSLRAMVRLAEERGIDRIGMPRIGAGLGGLRWPVVREIVERVGRETRVTLVVVERPGA